MRSDPVNPSSPSDSTKDLVPNSQQFTDIPVRVIRLATTRDCVLTVGLAGGLPLVLFLMGATMFMTVILVVVLALSLFVINVRSAALMKATIEVDENHINIALANGRVHCFPRSRLKHVFMYPDREALRFGSHLVSIDAAEKSKIERAIQGTAKDRAAFWVLSRGTLRVGTDGLETSMGFLPYSEIQAVEVRLSYYEWKEVVKESSSLWVLLGNGQKVNIGRSNALIVRSIERRIKEARERPESRASESLAQWLLSVGSSAGTVGNQDVQAYRQYAVDPEELLAAAEDPELHRRLRLTACLALVPVHDEGARTRLARVAASCVSAAMIEGISAALRGDKVLLSRVIDECRT